MITFDDSRKPCSKKKPTQFLLRNKIHVLALQPVSQCNASFQLTWEDKTKPVHSIDLLTF